MSAVNFYNENDPKAAAWLRELIRGGHIADGIVDERDIRELRGSDLAGFCQCHFFAGIGGWSYALRLAGWPDDEPVWTGSCPCQPFSSAGKAQGLCDERHLWPAFRGLIAECHPAIVFGEQVASKDGRAWLAGVRSDLEGDGYAVGAADLCAASVGAPHIRQRLYWVANSNRPVGDERPRSGQQSVRDENQKSLRVANADRTGYQGSNRTGQPEAAAGAGPCSQHPRGNCESGRLADANSAGCAQLRRPGANGAPSAATERDGGLALASGLRLDEHAQQHGEPEIHSANGNSRGEHFDRCRVAGGVGDAGFERDESRRGTGDVGRAPDQEQSETSQRERSGNAAASSGAWSNFQLIPCRDGKARRIESGTFPLADGVSGRVGLLRGYGNAIVPQVAAEFIRASIEAMI